MPLPALIFFYRRRLRSNPIQEALAGAGIAIGVALVFAVQVASSSLVGDSGSTIRSIVGAATLQLRARSETGVDSSIVRQVRALPGVRRAAPVLNLTATVQGPHGRAATVQLASGDGSLAALAGMTGLMNGPGQHGVLLPRATARRIGVSETLAAGIPHQPPQILLSVRGRSVPVPVGAVLGPEIAGPLANSMAVIAPLQIVQYLGNLPRRISGVLVQPQPGKQSLVGRELQALAGGRLIVADTNEDERLLAQATDPNRKATGFFAFVSVLVGLLLAFNAMLLSAPERRRMVADLRIQGTRPLDLVKLLLFQAVCLGLLASAAGVVIGDLLARGLFHEQPDYLAAAFPLGTQTVVGWQPIVLSLLGGTLAACVASAPPLLDLRGSRAVDAVYHEVGEPGHALSNSGRLKLLAAAGALLLCSLAAPPLLGPGASVVAIVLLALAALLMIPALFAFVLNTVQAAAERASRWNMLLVATRTLRATTASSLALAATGAVAVFGAVAAQGARNDLLTGLYRDYAQYVDSAQIWISNPRDVLATSSFPAALLPTQRIAAIPGVRRVREYQGGFLDLAGHRVWLIARSPAARYTVPPDQLLAGDPVTVSRRLREGGWLTLSQQLAQTLHARLGAGVTLPTPSGPVSYRLAGITTNLGWSGGAIALSQPDYRRAWASTDPSALEVDIDPSVSPAAVVKRINRLPGATTALQAQTSAARSAQADALARSGLDRLNQIALLLMLAAALAMAAAMGTSIWQRRPSLASLRIQSFQPAQLRAVLACEATIVLATGAFAGAAAGTYGHLLIDRYLRLVTGFPAAFSPAAPKALLTVALIVAGALLVLAVPGSIASRAAPGLALQEQA
jgi:putative ABC transport system permease protein